MNKQEQPPEFKAKPKLPKQIIILVLVCAILSGVLGFTGGYFASNLHSSGSVTVNQVTGKTSGSSKVNDVSDIASKCGPSVVEITTESVSNGNSIYGQYISEGAGSGIVYSKDGYIVTNNHVIEGASSITVTTTDGKEYAATLVGSDSDSDLAVLKIDASNLTPVTLGDSSSLEVGDIAIAIGNPLGELGGTVTEGIISALDRQVEIDNTTMTLLQTDASISPGNSGGGLFDANGNLIGIVNAKYSSSSSSSNGSVEGIGFAIPINSVTDVINELITNGKVTNRAALNVSLYDYTEGSSNYYVDEGAQAGCYIVQVVSGGAADKAGLQKGDRIVSIDGTSISKSSEAKAAIQKHSPGDKVKIVVERDGKKVTKTVTLGSSNS